MSISDFISLDGYLDLIETWDDDLYDPTSSLYIDTSNNFTSEVRMYAHILGNPGVTHYVTLH